MRNIIIFLSIFFLKTAYADITNLQVTDVRFASHAVQTNIVVISGFASWTNEESVNITVTANNQRYTTIAYPADGKWSIMINSWNFIFNVQAWAPKSGHFTKEYLVKWGSP